MTPAPISCAKHIMRAVTDRVMYMIFSLHKWENHQDDYLHSTDEEVSAGQG